MTNSCSYSDHTCRGRISKRDDLDVCENGHHELFAEEDNRDKLTKPIMIANICILIFILYVIWTFVLK